MRIIYKMISRFTRYKRKNFVCAGDHRSDKTENLYRITKIPVARLCNRYIYFQSVTKKCTRKNLTKIEVWCIICLNQGKQRRGSLTSNMGKHSCRTERVIKMCQKQIKLNAEEEVQEFVKAAGKCDFDIDVFYNRIIIDAKSILGVLSMDLTQVLTVECHGENKEFNRILQKFAVA